MPTYQQRRLSQDQAESNLLIISTCMSQAQVAHKQVVDMRSYKQDVNGCAVNLFLFKSVLVEYTVFYSPIPNRLSSDKPNHTIFQYLEYAVFD